MLSPPQRDKVSSGACVHLMSDIIILVMNFEMHLTFQMTHVEEASIVIPNFLYGFPNLFLNYRMGVVSCLIVQYL
jgi:hypothetical protein